MTMKASCFSVMLLHLDGGSLDWFITCDNCGEVFTPPDVGAPICLVTGEVSDAMQALFRRRVKDMGEEEGVARAVMITDSDPEHVVEAYSADHIRAHALKCHKEI